MVSKALENMIRTYYTINGFVLLLLLDTGCLVSRPPIHTQVSHAFDKTAWQNQLISSIRRQDGL
jgi:hypothetical protein